LPIRSLMLRSTDFLRSKTTNDTLDLVGDRENRLSMETMTNSFTTKTNEKGLGKTGIRDLRSMGA
jgi:hypothetical protein